MKSNKGVTMMALVIIIVVLILISAVSIKIGVKNTNESIKNKQAIEVRMIYNAICQRYTKASLTGEKLPGEELDDQDIGIFEQVFGISELSDSEEYYKLNKDSLLELGIKSNQEISDEYIVNYKKGVAFNLTVYETKGEVVSIGI